MPISKPRWRWPRHGEINEAAARQVMLERLTWLACLLDSRFRIPGTSWRIGWDSLVGLIPGVGDVLSLAPALYIVLQGYRLGVPRMTVVRMLGWVVLDTIGGSIPIAGDVLDVFLKANLINIAILHAHVRRVQGGAVTAAGQPRSSWYRPGPERYTD